MPHLNNTLCFLNLDGITGKEMVQDLRDIISIDQQWITDMKMADGQPFCFIRFSSLYSMANAVKTVTAAGTYRIFQPHHIAQWFEADGDVPEEVKELFQSAKDNLPVPKASQQEALETLNVAFNRLVKEEAYDQKIDDAQHIEAIVHQPFSDKLIVKGTHGIALVNRDPYSKEMDYSISGLMKAPKSLQSLITLLLDERLVPYLFTRLNWSSIFKENNELLNGFVVEFFSSMASSLTQRNNSIVSFSVQLDVSMFFVDICIHHIKSQIERVKRHYDQHQSVVSTANGLSSPKLKPETVLESLSSLAFIEDPNFSVDDLYLTLQLFQDFSEQIWAQAKSHGTPDIVRNLVNSVSRPSSALNRLGSFISWGDSSQAAALADAGFFMREDMTVSHFLNPHIELTDLSFESLTNQKYLQQHLGTHNRHLNALVTENTPIAKTLNYFAPVNYAPDTGEILTSQNSDYFLVGGPEGKFIVFNSSLKLPCSIEFDFFNSKNEQALLKHQEASKEAQERLRVFEDLHKSGLKKSAHLAIMDLKETPKVLPPQSYEELLEIKSNFVQQQKKKPKGKKNKKPTQTGGSQPNQKINLKNVKKQQKSLGVDKEMVGLTQAVVPSLNAKGCKVLGYILLSEAKPSLHPVSVGCIFQHSDSKRFFLKVKRLTFKLQYLQSFVNFDPLTNQIIDKINGKQLTAREDLAAINQEILRHTETISALYPLFMSGSTLEEQQGNYEKKINVFDDIGESITEIDDCSDILDFTRCSYTKEASSKIFILAKFEGKTQLLEYSLVNDPALDDEHHRPFKIQRGKVIKIEAEYERVFSVEETVVLVSKENYRLLNQADLKILKTEVLCGGSILSMSSVSVVNVTTQAGKCCKANLIRGSTLPEQDWQLFVDEPSDYGAKYSRYILGSIQEREEKKTEIQFKDSHLDLSKALPDDIVLISGLLNSGEEGIIAVENGHSVLSSGSLDHNTGLPQKHTWHLLDFNETEKVFDLHFREDDIHLQQVNLRFGFTYRGTEKVNLEYPVQESSQVRQKYQSAEAHRLPLVVESNTGSQLNENTQVSILTTPDSEVFCSNYPQPEIIFRLQNGNSFLPTHFTIRSRENRTSLGVPISTGLIFVADSIEDLQNTKHFSRMSEEEIKEWFENRQLVSTPYLPSEPIVFFDLGDQTQTTLEVTNRVKNPIKYLKLVPIGFRKLPINFSSKPFNANQAELQFFGADGIEVTSSQKDIASEKLLSIQLGAQLTELKSCIELGKIDTVSLNEVRSSKARNTFALLSALGELSLPNQIAEAQVSLPIKQEHTNSIQSLRLTIPATAFHGQWVLSSVQVSVKSYSHIFLPFSLESGLERVKDRVRHSLFDIVHFDELLGQLLDFAQNSTCQYRVAALECITHFLQNNATSYVLQQFKDRTQLKKLIDDSFLSMTSRYQELAVSYLKKLHMLQSDPDYLYDILIRSQLPKLLREQISIQKVQNLFGLLHYIKDEQRQEIEERFFKEIFFNQICQIHLPELQTAENIRLRSKNEVDLFPFSEPPIKEDASGGESHVKTLPFTMKVRKLNSLYQCNVDFAQQVQLSSVDLYLETDTATSYKVLLRVIANDKVVFQRLYTEDHFAIAAEKAHKQEVSNYFKNEHLNYLRADLPFVGNYLTLQIEMQDTHRSVYKSQSVSSNFIYPKFTGKVLGSSIRTNSMPTSRHLVIKRDYLGLTYQVFMDLQDPVSLQKKTCFVTASDASFSLSSDSVVFMDEKEEQTLRKKIAEDQQSLRKFIDSNNQAQLFAKSEAVCQLISKLPSSSPLTLHYVLQLSNIIAGRINQKSLRDDELLGLFIILYKRFTYCDILSAHPNVMKLHNGIINRISEKENLMVLLIKDIIESPQARYAPFEKIVGSIESLENFDLSIMVAKLSLSLGQEQTPVDMNFEALLKKLWNSNGQHKVQTLIAITTLIDKFEINGAIAEEAVKLLVNLCLSCPSAYLNNKTVATTKSATAALKYLLHTINKLLVREQVRDDIQTEFALLILMALDQPDLKHLLVQVAQTQQWVTQTVHKVLTWYTENHNKAMIYQYETDNDLFYTHFAFIYSIYFEIIKSIPQLDSATINIVETTIKDVLPIMVEEQHSLDYEANFLGVWGQIFATLLQLDSNGVSAAFKDYVSHFLLLQPVYQQSIYPELLEQIQETSRAQLTINLLSLFLNSSNLAYLMAEGLINILQSGFKDKPSPQTISTNFNSIDQISTIAQIFVSFITKYVNMGVYTGVSSAEQHLIMRLELAQQLSFVLLNGQLNNKNGFSLLLGSCDLSFISDLLGWAFMNFNTNVSKASPVGSSICSLSTNVQCLLAMIGDSSESSLRLAMQILMKEVIDSDYKLSQLVLQARSINSERALQIQKTVNFLFLDLFKGWVRTDSIAKMFITELNGFDYIVDRLFSENSTQGQTNQDEEAYDYLLQIAFDKLKMPKAKLLEQKSEKEVQDQLVLEDWAKNLNLIWSSDKQGTIKASYKNWHWDKYKNGTKTRLYNYQITDVAHQYEYVMKFDLEQDIMLNEVQIGVVYNWSTYDSDCNHEPVQLLLEGGKFENKVDWRALLLPTQDDGYKTNSITVYGHNFVLAKGNASLASAISSIGCKEARYLTLRFRKPIKACMDQSLYITQLSKIKAFGLSYITVLGCQTLPAQAVHNLLLNKQQENSLEVLSEFFSGEFTQTFELISEQPAVIEKIKTSFDKLANLMNTKAALIKPIFLAICSQNKGLVDWILTTRLISMDASLIGKEQINFLGDILSSEYKTHFEKLTRVKKFILAQMGKPVKEKQILVWYMKLYNTKLRELAIHTKRIVELNYDIQDLDNILAASKDPIMFKAATKFILLLLEPPKPFKNSIITADAYVQKLLAEKDNLLFCSILASTKPNAINEILKLNLIEEVFENLDETGIQILYNCSKQKAFRDRYRESLPLKLYGFLKDANGFLRRDLSENSVKLLVWTIRDMIGEEQIATFAALLKLDMTDSAEIDDIAFINKVIVPILHAEEKVPVTVSFYDKKLLPIYQTSETEEADFFFLKTRMISKKQKKAFKTSFQDLVSDKVESFTKLVEGKWELAFEEREYQYQDPAKFKSFVKAVSGKANVIILVQCKIKDQEVVFGSFTHNKFPLISEPWKHEFDFEIPNSEANFTFHYTPDKELHFKSTNSKRFGYVYTDYEEGGGLTIAEDFFLVSWSIDFENTCGNLKELRCVEDSQQKSFITGMEVQTIEVWTLLSITSPVEGKTKKEFKKHPLYKALSPFNFFRQNIVFEVGSTHQLGELALELFGYSQIFIKYPAETEMNPATRLKTLVDGPILDLVVKKTHEQSTAPFEVKAIREYPLLQRFEAMGGVMDLLKAAKAAVKHYKVERIREIWDLWLVEIEGFSHLPSFLEIFCKDKSKEAAIYQLVDGSFDVSFDPEDQISQENINNDIMQYTYKIVSQVFELHTGPEVRDEVIKNGMFEKFIERITNLSSEKKRVRSEVPEVPSQKQIKKNEGKKKKEEEKKKKDENKAKKDFKRDNNDNNRRRGVGYTSGVGVIWNVAEYFKSKEAKSLPTVIIVNILRNILRTKDWNAPVAVKNMMLESAVLPTLEAAFRNGSLLDMAKEYDLNMGFLDLVEELAQHNSLLDLLLDIGDHYVPRQPSSVEVLLGKLNEQAWTFLRCLTQDSTSSLSDEQQKPRILAEKIQQVHSLVAEKVTKKVLSKDSLAQILELPLSEAYARLLSKSRFDYMRMKDRNGNYDHVFHEEISNAGNPPVSMLVRLAQEIADLSNSLPCDFTNAIFCRVDRERVDAMKCVIMGSSGTPYAHGAFVYDLFFDNTYPNSPPKCQLVTTGGQSVRFNPNLYNNGKVCLSLLGTWRGQSTENWDPKLSTILQVVLSIQAIIMSSDVYFNEPGYENEVGTPTGNRKNEGYANIIQYCNIKFAIIDAIDNPPLGFEKVIRSNFYLKKNEILKEVKEWVDKAKTSDALYTGLILEHNPIWAPQFQAQGRYAKMMEELYAELKAKLEALPSPFEDDGKVVERNFQNKTEQAVSIKKDASTKLEDIDVSYEPIANVQGTISIEDEKVKDRWSRYIGAMGIEAVAKQAQSRVLISGLGPLGVEVAKNIVLAGCKELILHDEVQPSFHEVSGQFFVTEEEVLASDRTKTRAHYSKDKLQQLNFYVKVTVLDANVDLIEYLKGQTDIKVVVLTDIISLNEEKLSSIKNLCHAKNFSLINSSQNGLFGCVSNDFGEAFVVLDKDGEELHEAMIKNIAYEGDRSVVKLLFKHKFAEGDKVVFKEVLGMDTPDGGSINGMMAQISIISPEAFSIDLDIRSFSAYKGNGIAKQVKVPQTLNFDDPDLFDGNLEISDFEKMQHKKITHFMYKTMLKMKSQDSFINEPLQTCELFLKGLKEAMPDYEECNKLAKHLAYVFCLTFRYSFPPIAAFLGGVVAQEIVKAITQKYMPIKQNFYFDCVELFPVNDVSALEEPELKQLLHNYTESPSKDRYHGVKQCIGTGLFKAVAECQLFMIGAGAIGCELLKNYAMLGIGTNGRILLTDPDVIEVSNLNRQFLFREKHLRKPKSQTAAAAAVQMNPGLKNHIEARLDKIHEGTADVYNESFFKDMTIVTNALDNVRARLYIDGKCVAARTPLIDSGTLGPKGHVQIVLPNHKTESYASQSDPEDNGGEIPQCTLKMFPEEPLHCVEWAKDLFGNLFTLAPQSFNKIVIEERDRPVNFLDVQERAALKKVIKTILKKPMMFDDCLRMARLKFQKHFHNDIKQLLHVYPLEKMTKEGRPFWSLPKRPPTPVVFEPNNQQHANAIASYACLLAMVFGVDIPYQKPRAAESKAEMAKKAAAFDVPEFYPDDSKASKIESAVEKAASKEEEKVMTHTKTDDVQTLKRMFSDLIEPLRAASTKALSVEEFEKDNDDNFHVDFIHAFTNVRAENYKLDEMDWITVKIKAGKIVPALATTTAAIAGLQTIELLKYLKNCKITDHRNSFLNLAVPSLMQSEPGPAAKTQLGALSVTLWDRWEYQAQSRDATLFEVLEYLEQTYKLEARDVFFGSVPLYMHALNIGKDRKQALQKIPAHLGNDPFVDLTVTFVGEDEKVLEGVPTVRVIFP